MSAADRYVKLVEWSDEDACFIGSCPELFYGGCHGLDPRCVFDELCDIVAETVKLWQERGLDLPRPMTHSDLVNTLQRIA